MRAAKATIQRAAEKLAERAEECFDRAEAQHQVADLQHENAEHIAALGHALEADAAELFAESETRAPLDAAPPKPRSQAAARAENEVD
jgi:hypothetical protein